MGPADNWKITRLCKILLREPDKFDCLCYKRLNQHSVAADSTLSRWADEPSRSWAGAESDIWLYLDIAQGVAVSGSERLRAAQVGFLVPKWKFICLWLSHRTFLPLLTTYTLVLNDAFAIDALFSSYHHSSLYREDLVDYNLNVNQIAQSPLDYSPKRANTTYTLSPENWQALPAYIILMDTFSDVHVSIPVLPGIAPDNFPFICRFLKFQYQHAV